MARNARTATAASPRRKSGLWLALLAGLASPGPVLATGVAGEAGLADLIEVADLTGLAASPDGNFVAFRVERARLDSNDHATDWYVADLETGAVRPVGPGGSAIYRDPGTSMAETPVWAPDGRYLYYRALIDDVVQVWRADVRGGGARAILRDQADVRGISLSADGRALILELGASRDAIRFAEEQEYDSGILIDETVDLGQNVYRGALINGRQATQRLTGDWFNRDGLLWRTPLRYRSVDLATLAVTDIAEAPAPTETRDIRMSSDIFTLTFASSTGDVATSTWNWRRREGALSVTRPGHGGRTITCSAELCQNVRIVWATWHPRGDMLVFATQEQGADRIHIWDVRTNQARSIAGGDGALDGGREGGSPCSVAVRAVVCVAAAPGAPPQVVSVPLDGGERRALFDPNERLRRTTLQPERLTWRGGEGHDYVGWLFVPPGEPRDVPLFVTYYSCTGFIRGGVGDEWPLEALARAGIASLCVDKTRVDLSDGDDHLLGYRAAVEGVDSIVRQLDTRGLVDPARVGMGGLSFGSEATLYTMINSDLLAAASITSPSFESSYYWLNGVRGRDNHDVVRRFWHLGAPEETPERWRQLSPAANVDRIRAPLLMQMPEQEARSAIELYARLTNSTTPVELYVFPEAPHLKFLPRHKLAAYERNLDWFRYWLQGYVDPDPLKAAQYRRWGELARRRDTGVAP